MSDTNLEARIRKLEHKIEVLNRLTDISTVLTSRLSLDHLLKEIMGVTVAITESEAASVLLWNNKTHELFFAASTSQESHDLVGKPVPMTSIAGRTLREQQPILVEDVKSEPDHYQGVDEDINFVTRSILSVPMIYKDKRIGVVQALNKRQLPWSDDDVQYLGVLAAQAAVAIEDAQMVQALKNANEELNELDKLKNDFIAIASHELRTPLGVILGYASFLQEETSESAQEHAGKVMASALQLRHIIEDMINLRYLKQKQSDLKRENITIGQIFKDLEYEVLAISDVAQSTPRLVIPADDPMIFADRSRLAMALTNLLNNAIAFTPKEGEITVTAERVDNEVWVRVQDTGIGLEADQLERVFEEFYQVEDHMVRHHGGLGIGLSITRAIVNAHDGRIWAESAGRDRGATFIFSLPCATDA